MEIQNANTTPSKSNQLRNVNTVRWESWNVASQPWKINEVLICIVLLYPFYLYCIFCIYIV